MHRSLILSVDMAHAIHPNYAAKHEKNHAPKMNSGVVIKSNSNQRYATNGITGFLAREMGRRAGVPVQEFAVRNDCPCGSTIGPTYVTCLYCSSDSTYASFVFRINCMEAIKR